MQTLTSNNDTSNYSDVVSDKPDGQGGTDATAPTISNVSSTEIQSSWARITWTTDELSNSEINYSVAPSVAFGSVASSTSFSTSHSVTLTGLTASTTYNFRVKSTDPSGNTATDLAGGNGYSFSTLNAPIISGVTVESVNENNATIFWNTNIDSDSYVVYSTNAQLSGSSQVGSSSFVGAASSSIYQHRVTITGLTQGTTYFYYVKSTDVNGTTATDTNGNNYYSFVTTNDVKPPVISNILVPVKSSTAAVIVWTTDEPATSQATYGTAAGALTNSTVEDAVLTISHVASLTSLAANTDHYFTVTSKDAAANSSTSPENTFKTTESNVIVIQTSAGGGSPPPPAKDTTAPTIDKIEVKNLGAFDATISFETNENSTGFIHYGQSAAYNLIAADPKQATKHEIRLSGLRLGAEYHFQVEAVDKEGNAANSPDQKFTTKFATEQLDDLITLENASGFQDKLEGLIESTLPSLVPPFVGKVEAKDVTENSATVTWQTNVSSYGILGYVADKDFNATTTDPYATQLTEGDKKAREHRIELANLAPGTQYHFQARAFIIPGAVGKSKDGTFTTKFSLVKPEVARLGNTEAEVRWTTEAETSSFVEFRNPRTGKTERIGDSAQTKVHSVALSNLAPATTYELRVFGYDEKNNIVEGNPLAITTKQDVTAPSLTNIRIDNALLPGRNDRLQSVISWKTNEPANSIVLYQEGSGVGIDDKVASRAGSEKEYTTDHVVIITGFRPATVYRMKIVTIDEAGNKSESVARTILTPRASESVLDIVIHNLQESFGFLNKLRQ
ncbi:fibronectin type III domain-containing protein [Candidatus Wolfebacteria bacterium]|nr:fibronectin type III domain-containing protein [Candidatus Wolfebacteria bacterium]